MRRFRSFSAALLLGLLVAGSSGCSSPNRGTWKGSFDGNVSGTVEFSINTRGTKLTGKMDGKTSDGQEFHATMEGSLRGLDLVAEFTGSATTEYRPVPFTGVMKGELVQGKSHGSWECTLRFTEQRLRGSWQTQQVAAPQ